VARHGCATISCSGWGHDGSSPDLALYQVVVSSFACCSDDIALDIIVDEVSLDVCNPSLCRSRKGSHQPDLY